MNYRVTCAALIILLSAGMVSGQSFTENKSYSKTVRVNREMTMTVSNKYGNIHLTPWMKDSVSVIAEVEATASTLKRLHSMFDGIDVEISESDYQVSIETEFTQNINYLLETIKGMTGKLIPYESRLRINYNIYVPEYLNTDITNKYGDVYMENCTGEFSLNLENGSFKANSLDKATRIELSFCDATINTLNNGHISASFSEVIIGESRYLDINSLSSRFDLDKALEINTKSRRDKFYILSVDRIYGDSYFTNFSIDNLSNEIDLDTKYGNLNVDNVEKNTETINVKSSFTDINLIFSPSVSYNLDIKHLNSFIVIPEDKSEINTEDADDEKDKSRIYGTIGRNPGNLKVKIDAVRGNIYLK